MSSHFLLPGYGKGIPRPDCTRVHCSLLREGPWSSNTRDHCTEKDLRAISPSVWRSFLAHKSSIHSANFYAYLFFYHVDRKRRALEVSLHMPESMHICFRNLDNCQMCEKKKHLENSKPGIRSYGGHGWKKSTVLACLPPHRWWSWRAGQWGSPLVSLCLILLGSKFCGPPGDKRAF